MRQFSLMCLNLAGWGGAPLTDQKIKQQSLEKYEDWKEKESSAKKIVSINNHLIKSDGVEEQNNIWFYTHSQS